MKHSDALAQLAREISRARRALGVERLTRLGLAPVLTLGAWSGFALAGGQAVLPPLAESLLAIAALGAIAWLFVRAARHWRAPSDADARARLAVDSQLDPAAFEALEDRPSKLDPGGLALWRAEQGRAIARAEHARARPAQPALDEADPWKLRFLIAAALVIGAIVAGPAIPDRLARAFYPDPGPLLGDGPIAVEAWLTPAPYTGAAPVSLSDRIGQRVEAPPSVEATVRVTGPRGAPVLLFTGGGVREEVLFRRAADGAYEARLRIPHAGVLKVVRFHTQASWRVQPGPDAAPRIAFTAPIALRPEQNISIGWTARDDYGVQALALRVTPVDPPAGLRDAAPHDTPMESPAGDPREAQDEARLDVADHPYAGLEVEARLVARDALGQEGVSAPMRLRLPEKVFLQPLARAAIEIRRMIQWERRAYAPARAAPGGAATMAAGDILTGTQRLIIRTDDQFPTLERAPAAIRTAARHLDALTMRPDDGYFADTAVFLGLRLARSALNTARESAETEGVAEILWRTALRAEYGGAADARRALEMAQQALADALQNGASQERIAELTEAMRQAMQNYMQALVQEARRQGAPETQEDTEEQTSLSQRDLQDVLDEIERLSQEGNQAAAQALLQQLANILQNLDVQLSQGESGERSGEQGQEGEESELSQSMEELSEAMGEQRQLNDQTEQAEGGEGGESEEQQQGQGGDGEEPTGEGLAQRQSDIRGQVGQARQQAGQAGAEDSEALSNAEQAMRRAEDALRRGAYEDARAAQDEAMENLREGAASLAAEMARRQQQRNAEEGEGEAGERDPLGRRRGGVGESGETQVPTQADRARSREILDELRRRAQDPRRPEAERDYLRRLLDRFTGS